MDKQFIHTIKPEDEGFSADRLGRIKNLLNGYVNQGELPGLIAMVARQGKIVYYQKSGWMDIEAQKPMQDDAIFMIASMTKPITAVAAMMLYEEGHFYLNTPISKFIPSFANTSVYAGTGPQGGIYLDDLASDITFRHLFTHTAGLSYGWDENDPIDQIYQQAQKEMEDQGVESSLRTMAEALAKMPLAFQPGTHWRYSLSIDVLGAIVEVISEMPLAQFIQERIFDPLGMDDTGFWVPVEKQDRLAIIYEFSDPNLGLQPLRDFMPSPDMPDFTYGGGGLWSTAPDYARFAQMLVNKGELDGIRLLSPTTVDLFSLNQCPEEALPYGFDENDIYHAGYGYSLGTRVLMDVAKSGMAGSVGEFGWDGKFHTFFWIDPVKQLYGLLMFQLDMEGRHPSHNHFKQLTYQALLD
jgi:CubicO group peptidase (beta-lactamase class C family)